ncbi:uncharacterized protein N7443_000703 [Penicillium atrosanguineum]|uniref:uncharacterized protein n=1 Tax=Penicillium atrosanguineum TaxID=1132637 RepID=UPI00239FF387|nr:uncharacterized protein N7443_000703 [Penicillium atrosanguineum]KAJ5147709.1 hypothetical protein N7526_001061 [Penicillium atrosanguineum]KAJ5313819.1 hypothetical protein N7443_000703 [Penicillium atrosanguineum]
MQRITAQLPRLVLRAPLRAARPLYLSCPPVPRQSRSFGNSPALYKKKDKAKNAPTPDPVFNSGEASEDLFDQSQLQNGIAAAISRLKDDLSKLRAGGRFNTASLEGLKVQLGKDAQDSVKLGDLAQVVPKGGRMVTILAAEEEHIKPLTSAIVSSNLSLTPQPDAHNPLQLNIPIPPPTKESRDQNVRAAKQAFEKAASTVRDCRGALHRRLQEMQKKKLARPDDVRKAHDQMEKATDKGQKDVKDMFEAARKTLEQT